MPYVAGTDLDGLQVALGAVRFNAVDAAGTAWRLKAEDGLQGWDGTDVRAQYTQREADHGAWAAPVYLNERVITLAGTIEADSRTGLDTAMEQLRGAAALTDTTLTVYETVPKQATVRRSGKPLLSYVTDRVANFSVLMTAGDPRRYATDQQTGSTGLPTTSGGLTFPVTFPIAVAATTVAGQITAANVGTLETRPVLTITGPVTAPNVLGQYPDGSVKQLLYGQDLGAGDQLIIDTDAHSVVLNSSASRRRFLSVPNGWPTIPAASTVTYQFTSSSYSASALLTARWRSAWI